MAQSMLNLIRTCRHGVNRICTQTASPLRHDSQMIADEARLNGQLQLIDEKGWLMASDPYNSSHSRQGRP